MKKIKVGENMKLPILYGKSSTNKYKIWIAEALEDCYKTTYGFENCKLTTNSRPVEAKNIGKKNETTKPEQAILEAKARWQKQIDKGYREDKKDIGIGDHIHPMKSGTYQSKKDRIVFPCYASPKLNGVKSIVPPRVGAEIKYQTSGGKYYNTLSHLDSEIRELFKDQIIPDGEVYIHGVDLQDISSAVKKHNKLTPDLEYWIYDIINQEEYQENKNEMEYLLENHEGKIKLCPVVEINSEEELKEIFKKWVSMGFEGVMVRNKRGIYKHGPNRSTDCLKFKDFDDAEFRIVGFEGDVHNRVVWICETKNGDRFKTTPKGTHAKRKKFYKNGDKYIGQMLTVRYLELSKSGIPQGNPVGGKEPIGECIRDYE